MSAVAPTTTTTTRRTAAAQPTTTAATPPTTAPTTAPTTTAAAAPTTSAAARVYVQTPFYGQRFGTNLLWQNIFRENVVATLYEQDFPSSRENYVDL